jgi:phosphotransacetylase
MISKFELIKEIERIFDYSNYSTRQEELANQLFKLIEKHDGEKNYKFIQSQVLEKATTWASQMVRSGKAEVFIKEVNK